MTDLTQLANSPLWAVNAIKRRLLKSDSVKEHNTNFIAAIKMSDSALLPVTFAPAANGYNHVWVGETGFITWRDSTIAGYNCEPLPDKLDGLAVRYTIDRKTLLQTLALAELGVPMEVKLGKTKLAVNAIVFSQGLAGRTVNEWRAAFADIPAKGVTVKEYKVTELRKRKLASAPKNRYQDYDLLDRQRQATLSFLDEVPDIKAERKSCHHIAYDSIEFQAVSDDGYRLHVVDNVVFDPYTEKVACGQAYIPGKAALKDYEKDASKGRKLDESVLPDVTFPDYRAILASVENPNVRLQVHASQFLDAVKACVTLTKSNNYSIRCAYTPAQDAIPAKFTVDANSIHALASGSFDVAVIGTRHDNPLEKDNEISVNCQYVLQALKHADQLKKSRYGALVNPYITLEVKDQRLVMRFTVEAAPVTVVIQAMSVKR